MAAVIICSDVGPEEKSLPLFPLFPHLFAIDRRLLDFTKTNKKHIQSKGEPQTRQ